MQHKSKKYLFFISQDYSFPILRPLQEIIWQKGDEVQWFMYGDEIHKNYILSNEKVLEHIEEVVIYEPDVVFVPGNVVPSFISGLKVEIFHGLPSNKQKKNGQNYHYIIRGMFDLYATQGPSSTKIFNLLVKKYQFFSVAETGWTKLDPLFSEPTPSKDKTQKSIFFASTFSPRFSKARILYPFLLEFIQKHDYHWYITLHPKMNPEIIQKYKEIQLPNVTFVLPIDVIPYMKKADIMLGDTSSIVYEFLMQHKPVVTFQTEKEIPYVTNVNDLKDLENALLNRLNSTEKLPEELIKMINDIHPYRDGHSSLRLIDSVEKMLQGENLPTKKKPLNLFRNFKLRRELSYWKF
jgi:hypothetical protein